MAASKQLTRSQVGASDVIYDFCCTTCSEDGKNTEAEHQCVDCPAFFCQRCVGVHNKLLKAHRLLDKAAMHLGNGQKLQKKSSNSGLLPTEMCHDHPGNVINMFCGQHDIVCCTVCIAVEHRSCDGVEYIPTVAKGILKGREKQQTQMSVQKVKKELLQLKARRENDLRLVDKQRDDMLNDVQTLKKSIITTIEELEKTSNKQVLLKHKEIADGINSDITSLEDILKTLQVTLDNIKQFKTVNEAQLFVHIKHGNAQASKSNDVINQVERKKASTIVYELDTGIESCLRGMKSLITLIDDTVHPYIASPLDDTVHPYIASPLGDTVHPYIASPLGEYSIKVEPDKEVPDIHGVCVLDNNQTIITNYNNNRLKRLDSTFKVTDWVDIPGGLWGICKTGPTELAVTLAGVEKVQFISVGRSLSLTRSFSVDGGCSGICHSQGELYVCGGYGDVRVYDMSGSELRVIMKQSSISTPNITVSRNNSLLYITDGHTGVIVIDKQGNKQTVITDPRLKWAYDVTVDDRDQLFVCGWKSHNVIQTDSRGNVLQELLTQTDGITHPETVTYLPNPPRIMVTQYNCDKINIFTLS